MENFEFSPIKKLLFTTIKLTKQDMEKQFSRTGITISQLQYWTLLKLAAAPLTLNDLAKQFNIKPPSLISVVDALEKSHLIIRSHDKKDRRKIHLIITKPGLNLLKKVPSNHKGDALHKAFQKLSLDKQKKLLELLQELIINFPK